jgi:hypothetical protein
MLPHSVTNSPTPPLIYIVYQLEIVGVRSVAHLSCVTVCHIAALPLLQVGSAFSLAVVIIFNVFQASSIELKFKPPASATSFLASFQIDGEPFTSPIGRISIPHNLANVLMFSQMEEYSFSTHQSPQCLNGKYFYVTVLISIENVTI